MLSFERMGLKSSDAPRMHDVCPVLKIEPDNFFITDLDRVALRRSSRHAFWRFAGLKPLS